MYPRCACPFKRISREVLQLDNFYLTGYILCYVYDIETGIACAMRTHIPFYLGRFWGCFRQNSYFSLFYPYRPSSARLRSVWFRGVMPTNPIQPNPTQINQVKLVNVARSGDIDFPQRRILQ